MRSLLFYSAFFMLMCNNITAAKASSLLFQFEESSVQEIKPTSIESLITELIKSVYAGDEYQFEVSAKRIPSQLEEKGVHIKKVRPSTPGLPKGYTIFDVDYEINGNKRVAKAQFNITVLQHLPVPLNRIEGGTPLSSDLFTYQWVDITNLRGAITQEVADVDGKVAAGLLKSGYPIRPTDLDSPPLIKAGDQVTMVFSKDGIQLALAVISRVAAPKGEVINAWCEATRKTYRVKVLNRTTVIWEQTL